MKRIILTTIIGITAILTVFSQDTCPNAVDITANLTATCNTIPGPFAFAGTPGGLEDACGLGSGPTDGIWFTFTAPFNGLLDVTNTNDASTPDTQVQLETGGCGAQTCVGDDDDGGTGFTSAAMGLPVVAGQQYWIEWTDGWNQAPENMDIRLVPTTTTAPAVTPGMMDAVVNAGETGTGCSVVYGPQGFTPSAATPGTAASVGGTITGLTPGTTYTICSVCNGFDDGFALCGYAGNADPESVEGEPICVDFMTGAPPCAIFADLAAAPTAPDVTNAACNFDDGTIIPGVIDYAPTMCPAGSTMQFSTDGGTTWGPGPGPAYDDANGFSFQIRCLCDEDMNTASPVTSVTTNPGSCPEDVPTLSQWGLITLMLMLMSYGAVALGRANNLVPSFKKK